MNELSVRLTQKVRGLDQQKSPSSKDKAANHKDKSLCWQASRGEPVRRRQNKLPPELWVRIPAVRNPNTVEKNYKEDWGPSGTDQIVECDHVRFNESSHHVLWPAQCFRPLAVTGKGSNNLERWFKTHFLCLGKGSEELLEHCLKKNFENCCTFEIKLTHDSAGKMVKKYLTYSTYIYKSHIYIYIYIYTANSVLWDLSCGWLTLTGSCKCFRNNDIVFSWGLLHLPSSNQEALVWPTTLGLIRRPPVAQQCAKAAAHRVSSAQDCKRLSYPIPGCRGELIWEILNVQKEVHLLMFFSIAMFVPQRHDYSSP